MRGGLLHETTKVSWKGREGGGEGKGREGGGKGREGGGKLRKILTPGLDWSGPRHLPRHEKWIQKWATIGPGAITLRVHASRIELRIFCPTRTKHYSD